MCKLHLFAFGLSHDYERDRVKRNEMSLTSNQSFFSATNQSANPISPIIHQLLSQSVSVSHPHCSSNQSFLQSVSGVSLPRLVISTCYGFAALMTLAVKLWNVQSTLIYLSCPFYYHFTVVHVLSQCFKVIKVLYCLELRCNVNVSVGYRQELFGCYFYVLCVVFVVFIQRPWYVVILFIVLCILCLCWSILPSSFGLESCRLLVIRMAILCSSIMSLRGLILHRS